MEFSNETLTKSLREATKMEAGDQRSFTCSSTEFEVDPADDLFADAFSVMEKMDAHHEKARKINVGTY